MLLLPPWQDVDWAQSSAGLAQLTQLLSVSGLKDNAPHYSTALLAVSAPPS